MTRREDRRALFDAITTACAAGARLSPACALAGIDARTFQRWRAGEGEVQADRRPTAARPRPSHALSEAERARIVAVANEPRFADVPPARIVPVLADEGSYLASEASFRRVLRDHGQMRRRGRARPPRTAGPPSTHVAAAPGQVWCWDVTFLPSRLQGHWFYLYLILDLFSRKVVGFEVHDTDQAEHAAHLVRRTALAEGIHARALRPVRRGCCARSTAPSRGRPRRSPTRAGRLPRHVRRRSCAPSAGSPGRRGSPARGAAWRSARSRPAPPSQDRSPPPPASGGWASTRRGAGARSACAPASSSGPGSANSADGWPLGCRGGTARSPAQ
jgi:hypothetical protein